MSDTPDWTPEPRPVPESFDPDFPHATYPPARVRFADWTAQLEAAKFSTLREWANGGAGEPPATWRDTELGDGE